MEARQRIKIRSSRAYFLLLLAIACLLILVISLLPLMAGWRWAGYIAVLICAAVLLRDAILWSAHACIALACDKDGHISLELRNGELISGEVGADTLVSPKLILLKVRSASHGQRSLLLFPDAMTSDEYRRLRVLLRNASISRG